MKAFPVKVLRGALLLGAAALCSHSAAAENDLENGGAVGRAPISQIDLTPPLGYLNLSHESGGVDFAPTGATPASRAPLAKSAEGESTKLDFSPTISRPEASLPAAETPSPSISAAIPMPTAPPSAPAPTAAPSAVEPQRNAVLPAEAPASKPEEIAKPASVDQSPPVVAAPLAADISDLLRVALEGMASQTPVPKPAGMADWKAAREAVKNVYATRNHAPIWVNAAGLNEAGQSLLARLREAAADGIDLSGFALPDRAATDFPAPRLAQIEITLSAAAVAYALQASGGRIVPTSISRLVTAKPDVADPGKALAALAAATDPGAALWTYNPPHKAYVELRAALARLRATAAVASKVPVGPVLKVGMTDVRVPLIRARFGLGSAPDVAQVYDSRVASAVASFQRTHGLRSDGTLNSATADALFVDPTARRQASIVANMEMWRWEPRDLGQLRVEVNIPDFTLHVMDGDSEIHRTRVIVGKPDTPTPVFSNAIKYLLINPAWHVPESIIKKEMAPRLANDPGYLERRGFKVTYIGNHLVVEQPPGEGNALGRILFMFPNEHSVYLHDTPSRGLFATQRRAYSHGCVRVEGPAELAELVMGGASQGWTAAKVRSMVGSTQHTIPLARMLPIHIEYFTAFVDTAGELQEREDVYGLTAQVAATLFRQRQD